MSTAQIIFTIAFFITASVHTFDKRLLQAQHYGDIPPDEPILPRWVDLISLLHYGIIIVLFLLGWKLALIVVAIGFMLASLPVLEIVGNILMAPFRPMEPAALSSVITEVMTQICRKANTKLIKEYWPIVGDELAELISQNIAYYLAVLIKLNICDLVKSGNIRMAIAYSIEIDKDNVFYVGILEAIRISHAIPGDCSEWARNYDQYLKEYLKLIE